MLFIALLNKSKRQLSTFERVQKVQVTVRRMAINGRLKVGQKITDRVTSGPTDRRSVEGGSCSGCKLGQVA